MAKRSWRCWLGLHTPPDPATPRPDQHGMAASFDCGYPPYAWRCRACGRWYGGHRRLPPFDTDRAAPWSRR